MQADLGNDSAEHAAAQQLPPAGKINVDHISHFVPDMTSASPALEQLGFTLTPLSEQSHRLKPGGPLTPAGSANRCIMLERGYLEFLTPTADTAMGAQLQAAIARYVGVHVIAFGTSTPDLDHKRLSEGGFSPTPPVALQREISTPNGERTARFTVVRVPPGTMEEGRIQYCAQLTPEFLWQPRWLHHANGAVALRTVLLCVADPAATAQRYGRYTGLTPAGSGSTWHIDTSRGRLLFTDSATIRRTFNTEAPTLPWIVGYAVESNDMAKARRVVAESGYAHGELADERCYAVAPEAAVGGIIVFEKAGAAPLSLHVP